MTMKKLASPLLKVVELREIPVGGRFIVLHGDITTHDCGNTVFMKVELSQGCYKIDMDTGRSELIHDDSLVIHLGGGNGKDEAEGE